MNLNTTDIRQHPQMPFPHDAQGNLGDVDWVALLREELQLTANLLAAQQVRTRMGDVVRPKSFLVLLLLLHWESIPQRHYYKPTGSPTDKERKKTAMSLALHKPLITLPSIQPLNNSPETQFSRNSSRGFLGAVGTQLRLFGDLVLPRREHLVGLRRNRSKVQARDSEGALVAICILQESEVGA